MCHSLESRPPIEHSAESVPHASRPVLQAADGNRFQACLAHSGSGQPGVIILPDIRGLHTFYEDLAHRFAERGINAIAMDYFGRLDGPAMNRPDDFDWVSHVRRTSAQDIRADVDACERALREVGSDAGSIFLVGFCYGGRHAWLLARDPAFAGSIGFYGNVGPGLIDGSPGPLQLASQFTQPVLALMGGNDANIPLADALALRKALEHDPRSEVVIYPEAPHSFFDRLETDYQRECADAWDRILAFIGKHRRPAA